MDFSERIFFVLATILIVASGVGVVTSLFSQPLILAYILSGALIGFLSSNFVAISTPTEVFGFFSQIGIALILFMVGIELSTNDLKSLGRPVFLATAFHGLGIGTLGFLLAFFLKFNFLSSLYIALALTFSSTVIVIKLLDDLKDTNSLYGKLTIGVLLLQDLVAVFILMILAGIGPKTGINFLNLILAFAKGGLLVGALLLFTKYVIPKIFSYVATNLELMLLTTLAWALGVSSVWRYFGFSFEIGAFLAGIALANLPFRYSISSRIAPIRDFFIIIFFIVLGLTIDFAQVKEHFLAIMVFSIFVIVATPLLVANYLKYLGFGKRVALLSGISLAQVSEFSLILVVVGKNLGHVTSDVVSIISSVAVITIVVSSYLITSGSRIYRKFGSRIKLVEGRQGIQMGVLPVDIENHMILVGAEQMGSDILTFLKSKEKESKTPVVVVDFNPRIIKTLQASGVKVLGGDIADPETLEALNLEKARLIVTTVPDVGDNINLIKYARDKNFKGPVIAVSYWIHEAIKLYEAGADYVIVPETVGGKHVARILSEHWDNLNGIKKARSKHFEELISHKIF